MADAMRMKYFSMQYFLWQCCSPRIPSSENMNTWRQGILTSSLMISHSTSRVWELVGVVLVPPMVPVHMHMTCLLLLWQHVSRLRWPSEWLQESFIMITVLCRNDKRIKLNEKKADSPLRSIAAIHTFIILPLQHEILEIWTGNS